jgi:hypothetical protein
MKNIFIVTLFIFVGCVDAAVGCYAVEYRACSGRVNGYAVHPVGCSCRCSIIDPATGLCPRCGHTGMDNRGRLQQKIEENKLNDYSGAFSAIVRDRAQ